MVPRAADGDSMTMRQVLPTYMAENKDVIKTGSEVLDQILFVLLSTSMFIAGFLGCVLDNTIPGEREGWRGRDRMTD